MKKIAIILLVSIMLVSCSGKNNEDNNAIKELKEQKDSLEKKNNELQEKNDSLEKENKELDPYPGDFGTKKVPDLDE